MRIVLPILAVALMPTSALANPEQPKTQAAEEKVICKGERSLEFGSHRRAKKVCKTEAEWKQLEEATQRELQAFRERTQTHGTAQGR